MKFSANQDVDIAQYDLFERMSNFGHFEGQAIRRGVTVVRQGLSMAMVGLKWKCVFKLLGRDHAMVIELSEFDQGNAVLFNFLNFSLNIRVRAELSALSRQRIRVHATSVLEPKTLAARLLVQSMKLGRSKFNKRLQARLVQLCKKLSERG
jgi:hypothetical protein